MKPKDQGTRWETTLVAVAEAYGFTAKRIAEGGIYDEGDILITHPSGVEWVIEARDRAAMNIHDALRKAIRKADGRPAAVAWKRLTRKDGHKRRTPVGEPVIVAITPHDFFSLLAATQQVTDHQEVTR